jgi:hypothetical protein
MGDVVEGMGEVGDVMVGVIESTEEAGDAIGGIDAGIVG